MNEQLIDTLNQVGKTPFRYRSPDGTELLILPYGARILGLFAPASGENFYWTHPALEAAASAAEFYAGAQWHNSGGDRTWLAPEVDFFFPNFPKTDVYWQPRQLDPGQWQVVATGQTPRLIKRPACSITNGMQPWPIFGPTSSTTMWFKGRTIGLASSPAARPTTTRGRRWSTWGWTKTPASAWACGCTR